MGLFGKSKKSKWEQRAETENARLQEKNQKATEERGPELDLRETIGEYMRRTRTQQK